VLVLLQTLDFSRMRRIYLASTNFCCCSSLISAYIHQSILLSLYHVDEVISHLISCIWFQAVIPARHWKNV